MSGRTRSIHCPWLYAAALLLAAASVAPADQLELSNGDVLRGVDVVEQTEAEITFTHPAMGTVTMPRDRVAAIQPTPDEPDKPEAPAPAEPRQQQPPQPEPAPKPAAPPAPQPQPEPDKPRPLELKLFGVPIMDGWDRTLELSGNARRGNSETGSFRVGFEGKYENDRKRWDVDTDYSRSTSRGELNRHELRLDLTRDWLVPDKPYFYFVKTVYQYDDFDTWRHDYTLTTGMGYQFYDNEELDLIGRLGGGGNYTWDAKTDQIEDVFTPEGFMAIEGTYRIDLIYPLEIRNEFYPDLGELGEHRNITELAFHVPVDVAKGMKLKVGLYNEYESETEDDTEHNDVNYFASLELDF